MAVLNQWLFPKGSLTRDGWEAVVDGNLPQWSHTGLHVAELDGGTVALPAAAVERIVVPLAGRFTVSYEETSALLTGRTSVFDGPTDVLYVASGQALCISGHGRVAVAESSATEPRPSRYIGRSEVPVEIRGAGRATRQIHSFGWPGTLDAVALLVCEVITPAGNWSSYPGHKHDESLPGKETQLEEIYYFEVAPTRAPAAPSGTDAFGMFATYSSSAGEIETRALVRTGDIALVPYGYHGPAAAAPDYDLYYLNIMAGPERDWLFSDDPAQAWVRSSWAGLEPDPRLPYTQLSPEVTP